MAGDIAPTPAPVAPEPVAEPETESVPSAGMQRATSGGGADTAALLRELSSLGDEEPAARNPAPAPRPRPAPASHAAAKKRKGLWGRS
jgi:hypothetical protein